ncbi:hypothetical protein B296_00011900 [Ensete ventricosum]|uniref:Peptidase C14 caspase domain-containing protein n=1 Tax=Ensete ventricosum TaxID=4639 RepID=A0A426XN87_ENSVE|nr:hypothetical protein B296_00011900 [Ensete ventricosum]
MEAGKKRLATLVGCNYAHTRHELNGCINDVHAMRDVLVSRFSFAPDDVVLLTDAPGSAVLPTGANIRGALAAMIDRAEPGDVLFFHYSGHGTLIPPVRPHHGWHKPDEAIVPCDFNLITGKLCFDLCNVAAALHDLELHKEQIGPSTVATGSSAAVRKARAMPFESVLSHLASLSGIDSLHVGDHLVELFGAEASARFSTGGKHPMPDPLGHDDGILLSGCQANETSADMSPFEAGGKAYGAFTNAVQVVLFEKEGAVSNQELVMGVRKVLRHQGLSQHPCLYCSDENAAAPFLWPPPHHQQLQLTSPLLVSEGDSHAWELTPRSIVDAVAPTRFRHQLEMSWAPFSPRWTPEERLPIGACGVRSTPV